MDKKQDEIIHLLTNRTGKAPMVMKALLRGTNVERDLLVLENVARDILELTDNYRKSLKS